MTIVDDVSLQPALTAGNADGSSSRDPGLTWRELVPAFRARLLP